MDPDVRAFYEYYDCHMEPWDGPAGIVLTDGRYAACCLDRNGLRPARFVITRDRHITIASEIGVYDYDNGDVVSKGRLGPGEMLAVDLREGVILSNDDIHDILKARAPYKKWLKQGVRYLDSELVDRHMAAEPMDRQTLTTYQKMFNLSREELNEVVSVLARAEQEAVGSMGDDTPMPVLSKRVRPLFDYFRQQFAQVTNPPIDSLRERIVMSLQTNIGREGSLFDIGPHRRGGRNLSDHVAVPWPFPARLGLAALSPQPQLRDLFEDARDRLIDVLGRADELEPGSKSARSIRTRRWPAVHAASLEQRRLLVGRREPHDVRPRSDRLGPLDGEAAEADVHHEHRLVRPHEMTGEAAARVEAQRGSLILHISQPSGRPGPGGR
jgi:hypothetical protein